MTIESRLLGRLIKYNIYGENPAWTEKSGPDVRRLIIIREIVAPIEVLTCDDGSMRFWVIQNGQLNSVCTAHILPLDYQGPLR